MFNDAPETDSKMLQPVEFIPPTIREELLQRRQQLERQLSEVNAGIKALDENPGFEKTHNAISKIRGIGR